MFLFCSLFFVYIISTQLYDKGGEENLGTSGGASCKVAGMNCVKNADCCNNKCTTFPAPFGSNCNNGGLCGQCAWSDSPFENRGAELASELVNDVSPFAFICFISSVLVLFIILCLCINIV